MADDPQWRGAWFYALWAKVFGPRREDPKDDHVWAGDEPEVKKNKPE